MCRFSVTTLSIMTFSIMTLSTTTLGITKFCKVSTTNKISSIEGTLENKFDWKNLRHLITFIKETLMVMIIIRIIIKNISIIIINVNTEHHYGDCYV